MISHKYKFIFVHVGRTGGSTFERLADVDLTSDEKTRRLGNTDFREKHESFQYYRRRYPKEFASYFKFTIVRNPFERVVSSWFWLTRVIKGMTPCTLKEFIRWRPADSTFAAKYALSGYSLEDSLKQFDYIGRFEDLPRPYEELCNKLGVPWKSMPHTNQTAMETYWNFYDPETISLVHQMYGEDLALFDYAFGPPAGPTATLDELRAIAPRVTSGRKEVESVLQRQRAKPLVGGTRFYPARHLVHDEDRLTLALDRSDDTRTHLFAVPTRRREHLTPELGQPITAEDLDEVAELMTAAERAAAGIGVTDTRVFLDPSEMISVGYLRVHVVGAKDARWKSPHVRAPLSAPRLVRRVIVAIRNLQRPLPALGPAALAERERMTRVLQTLRTQRAAELNARGAYFEQLTRGDAPGERVVYRDALVTGFLHRSDPSHPSQAADRKSEPSPSETQRAHLLVVPNVKRAHLTVQLDQEITVEDLREVGKVMAAARRAAIALGIRDAVHFVSPSEAINVGYLHVHVVGTRVAATGYPKV
jgi:chondroitin 4-sulfotransferase 11